MREKYLIPEQFNKLILSKNFDEFKNKTINYLTIISLVYSPRYTHSPKVKYAICECVCGVGKNVSLFQLLTGRVKSCGCQRVNMIKSTRHKIITHNRTKTPEHNVWINMRFRCSNPKCTKYNDYGGRGISVCDRWDSFECFLSDMGERPSKKHSLDRINNDGNYEPDNCRWATRSEQLRNTRFTHFLEYGGERKSVSEWAEIWGIARYNIYQRIKKGWTADEIKNTPVKQRRKGC